MCCWNVFQSASNSVEHGLSLWLPQLRNYNKLSTASAEDTSEVCVCVCSKFIYAILCLVLIPCIVYWLELTAFLLLCKICHLFSLLFFRV